MNIPEEIFRYLKDNLRVIVTNKSDEDYDSNHVTLKTTVELVLTNPETFSDELISEDSSTCYFSVRD